MVIWAETSGGMQPLFEDYGIPLAVMGILVVFAALTLVSVFINYLPRIMNVLDHLHPEKHESHAPVASKRKDQEEIPEEEVAVIAAAIAMMMSHPHRIVHIRGLTPEDLGWSLEGRIQHHTSHKLPRRNPG